MRLDGRFTLLGYNVVVALICAAAMVIVVNALLVEPAPDEVVDARTTWTGSLTASQERLAYVPRGMLYDEPSASRVEDDEPPPARAITGRPDTGGWTTTEQRPELRSEQVGEQRAEPQPTPIRRFTLLPSLRLPWQKPKPPPQRQYTLKTRLAEISPTATTRLAARFDAAKVAWPPTEITLVAIKDEKLLELHARSSGSAWRLVHRYPVLAASGTAGPKLRQGDKQVPEGIYSIAFLNPNSAYHVSLAVNYPNAFDRLMATRDGRKELGGDIMIHGKNLSAGCLAMGDEAVEEIFVLAAQSGLQNVKLIIAPTDFRQHGLPTTAPGKPDWLPQLYAQVASAMAEFHVPKPKATGLLSFFSK